MIDGEKRKYFGDLRTEKIKCFGVFNFSWKMYFIFSLLKVNIRKIYFLGQTKGYIQLLPLFLFYFKLML